MEPAVPGGAGRRQSVLVCDDTESIRRLLAMMLDLDGFEVIEASDGAQALALLGELPAGAIPSVLIVDAQMSPGDGWSVLASVRADERLRHIPVLMASAEVTCADRDYERATTLGLDACLTKPFEPDRVLELVRGFALQGRAYRVPGHVGSFKPRGHR